MPHTVKGRRIQSKDDAFSQRMPHAVAIRCIHSEYSASGEYALVNHSCLESVCYKSGLLLLGALLTYNIIILYFFDMETASASEDERLSSSDSDIEETAAAQDAAPIFEDEMNGNLVAFADELEVADQVSTDTAQTVTLQETTLADLRTDDPLDALHYFWQPDHNTNHCLVLPIHSDAEDLRCDNMKVDCHLDYFLAIGKDIGLGPISIEPGLSGVSCGFR